MGSWFLEGVNWWYVILGSTLMLFGLALIYRAWRQPRRDARLLSVAWGLVALACWPWVQAAGFDRGLAAGSLLLMLAGLALVAWRGDWRRLADRSAREAKVRPAADPLASARTGWITTLGRFALAGPLAFAAALSVSLMLFALSVGSEANRLMTTAVMAIVLWTGFMTWSLSTEKPLRAAGTLVGASCMSLLGILVA